MKYYKFSQLTRGFSRRPLRMTTLQIFMLVPSLWCHACSKQSKHDTVGRLPWPYYTFTTFGMLYVPLVRGAYGP